MNSNHLKTGAYLPHRRHVGTLHYNLGMDYRLKCLHLKLSVVLVLGSLLTSRKIEKVCKQMTINMCIFTLYKQLTLRNEWKHHLRNRYCCVTLWTISADEISWDTIMQCLTHLPQHWQLFQFPAPQQTFSSDLCKLLRFSISAMEGIDCRSPADREAAWINILMFVKHADAAVMERNQWLGESVFLFGRLLK